MAVKIFLSSQLCLLFLLTHITDADSCPNQTLTDWTGSFQSSNWPNHYAPNLDCYWLIQVSAGNLIQVILQDFVMDGDTVDDCTNDYVEFLEGSYGSTDSIKRLCGANLPFEYRRVRSKGSSLLVHMHTDPANENRGFSATHQGICDVTFSTVSGTIMSPNHPDKYPISMACEWIIDLGPGYDITIIFHKFDLEKNDDCSFDWLMVQAGNTPDSPEVAKVCGDVLPPDMTTRGPMRIVFQTDTDNEFEGFHVTWLAHEPLVQNATETVQLVAGNITVSTMQPPNPVTATTVDIWSAKTREFVQSVPAVSITGSRTPAPDSLTSAIVNKRSATATADVLFQSVAASKTEPWLGLVTDADSCPNQTLTVWTGTFQPSSYPSDYAPNLDCYWLIQVSAGNLIEINFHDFVMDGDTVDNCINDYVEFLEGSYGSTDSIKRLCGANLPFEYRRVRSKGSSLLVHMHTDPANENRGFSATHQGICDVTFSTVSGTIMSPNHPDKYPNSVACEWIIDLGPGYDITITFHKFDLEKNDDCSFDWLMVQAGNTPDSPEVAKVCGDVLPPDMTTRGPMRIVFQTDTDNEFEGFHVTWLAHESLVQNATETVQLVAGNITVSTKQLPNPVTAATVDIWSAKTREFVQSVPAVSITGSSTPAPDSLTSAIVNKRSATATVDVLFLSVAASKTEPWVSFVVLITTIACLNLLSFK